MAIHADIKLVPGTEIVTSDSGADKALIPIPSSDPRDPLNWSKTWKSESYVQSLDAFIDVS